MHCKKKKENTERQIKNLSDSISVPQLNIINLSFISVFLSYHQIRENKKQVENQW